MAHYLLVLEETGWGGERIARHVVQAPDRQMVKYHYHRTLKDWGWSNTQHGKHALENWDSGIIADILEIKELGQTEAEVLKKHLNIWPQV